MKNFKKLMSLVVAMAVVMSGVFLTAVPQAKAQDKWKGRELVVIGWGGAIQAAQRKTIFDAFEKATGAKIVEASDPDPAKLKAMVESGNMEIDVWDVDSDVVPRAIRDNLLEPLDFKVISKDGLIKEFVTEFSVPSEIAPSVISWNTNFFSQDNHPKTWAEFFDTKTYPGKRTLYTLPTCLFEAILLADGVPIDQLYPLDVDRVFRFLDAHKADIVKFWESGAESVELLASGAATLGQLWPGRVISGKKDGRPLDFERNQAVLIGDAWVIGKGSKNIDVANDFISFATTPQIIADYSVEYPGNAPANILAYDLMTAEQIANLASSPAHFKNQVYINVDWWMDNYDSVIERFQEWKIQ